MKTPAELASSQLTDLLSLHGRTAVVTGGASGIGMAIAKRLHEAGARVVIGDLAADKAQTAAKVIDSSGQTAIGRLLDVTDSASIHSLADEAVRSFGRLDIWVNNAGGRPNQTILEMTDAQFDAVVNLNLRGTFLGAREAAQRMVRTETGVIINIASVTAFDVRESPVHYVASKHGIIGLTKTLAVELGPHGVRAIAIAPTLTETAGVAAERAAGFDREFDAYGAALPLGRLASPDDVARVTVFAASDLAAYVTGSVIPVDGGDLAR